MRTKIAQAAMAWVDAYVRCGCACGIAAVVSLTALWPTPSRAYQGFGPSIQAAICGSSVIGGAVDSCVPKPTIGFCPSWWTPDTFAFNYVADSRTWGHTMAEACALAPIGLPGTPGSTTQFLGDTAGCKDDFRDPYYGTPGTQLLRSYSVCFPSGANPLPPFQLAPAPLGCATGAGGFQWCQDPPKGPDTATPPGTPVGGGLSPNVGVPGTDSSPGPDQPVPPMGPKTGGASGASSAGASCSAAQYQLDASAVADPIFAGTGNNFYQETDISGPRGLNLVRTYNSSLPGWTHNWNLKVIADGSTALVIRHDGRAHRFAGSGPGAWTAEAGTREQLVQLTPADASNPLWMYVTATDTREFYDSQGNLMSITLRGGYSFTAVRSGGQLTDIVDPFGRSLHFGYDSGVLSSVTAPDGSLVSYGFDTRRRLTSASFPGGKSSHYVYENASYPFALTGLYDGRGVRVGTWGYDEAGRAASYSSAGGVDRYQLAYENDGSATITDPLGTTRTQAYVAAGARKLFAGQSKPCASCTGDAASKVFDVDGLLGQTTDFLGVTTQITNDGQRKLPIAITRAAGTAQQQQLRIQWDANFRLPALVTEPGRTTAFTYDSAGNMLTRTVTDTVTSASRTWRWTYTAQGLPLTMTDPAGGQWAYGYDDQGNVASIRDPLSRQTRFTHDVAGRVLARTEPNGLVVSYSYDPRGRLSRMVRDGDAITYTYTPAGQLQSVYMPSGYGYIYAYDDAQRLLTITDTRGPVLTYQRDAMGNATKETLTFRNTVSDTGRVFDSTGRVSTVTGGEGRMMVFNHDANGDVTGVAKFNESTGYQLDSFGRPVAMATADGAVTRKQWNGLGQLTQVIDPKGVSTGYSVNAFGEVTVEASLDIGAITYERDAAGRITAMTDTVGNRITVSRDALGRPRQVTAASQSRTFDYDAGGYVIRIEDEAGSIAFTRNLRGDVLAKDQTINANPSAPSQFSVSYGYIRGDLNEVRYPSGLLVHYVRQAGLITGIQVQEPGTIPNPQLGCAECGVGPKRIPKPMVMFLKWIEYTAWNQPLSWTWLSGDSASRSFDREGKMTENEFASYSFDPAGRMSGITQNLWYSLASPDGTSQIAVTPLSWNVGYDNRGRVVSFSRAGASSVFTYDANSNRLTSVESTTSNTDLNGEFDSADFQKTENRTLTVDGPSNHLLGFKFSTTKVNNGKTRSTASSTVAYALDANGSMTSDGLRTFEYDEFGRLEKVRVLNDGQSAIVTYLTNAQGQRVFKSEPTAEQTLPDADALGDDFIAWLKQRFRWLFASAQATTSLGTAYIYGDGELPPWALLGEYDNGSASGKGRTEYIWLPTPDGSAIPVGMYRGGKLYAIHTDHLGTPRLVTNKDGAPVWQWPYSAFGQNKPAGPLKATANAKTALMSEPVLLAATSPVEFNLRFLGQYFDAETGTHQNYMRDYDPLNGRYRQGDPIGLMGGINRFGYVGGDPLNYSDPSGLNPAAGAMAGAGAGSAFGPVGTAVGGLIGGTVGAIIGWNFIGPMLQEKTPNVGTPGEWHTNPGSGQERLYGPDGRPAVDIDWDHDHGQGMPHPHNWGPGGREVPEGGFSPWPRGRTNPFQCPR